MESGVFELLLEHGSLGLFAAFLVYQHLNMQKRFDALIQNFQEQLEKIQSIQKSEINEIRDRYDKVLESYNDERRSGLIWRRKLLKFKTKLSRSRLTIWASRLKQCL